MGSGKVLRRIKGWYSLIIHETFRTIIRSRSDSGHGMHHVSSFFKQRASHLYLLLKFTWFAFNCRIERGERGAMKASFGNSLMQYLLNIIYCQFVQLSLLISDAAPNPIH